MFGDQMGRAGWPALVFRCTAACGFTCNLRLSTTTGYPAQMKTAMFYREILPHPSLRPYIHMYGILNEENVFPETQHEMVPPSVGKGLIFWLNPKHKVLVNNGTYSELLPPGFILPQGTRSNLWTHHGGFQTFAVIFKPGKFRLFFPFPLIEYLNSLLKLEDLTDSDVLNFYESIHLAASMEDRVRLSNRFFLKKLNNIRDKNDLSDYVLKRLHTDLELKISDLSQELCISRRHLRRVFTREIGIQPKHYQKLVRISATLAKLGSMKFETITEVAYQCGYYDQAHFIENFKEFTGMTPSEYLRRTVPVTASIHWREEVTDGLEIKS